MTTEAPSTRVARLRDPLRLDSGIELPDVHLAYRTWGRLHRDRSNAVLVCHALTGSADVDAWWPDLLGPGRALDPARDFVVCSNVLGSCYGTTGPRSPRPGGDGAWGPDFPAITIRDIVRAQSALLDLLGIDRLRLVVGGSLGGMQVLEWGLLFPDRVEAIAPIAASARHSAWCIGLSEAQRHAIAADPAWRGGHYPADAPPRAGLAAARMIAMCAYRSPASFDVRFGRRREEDGRFAVESYLQHQGQKLVDRFDANAYVTLTRAMDSHDVGQGRDGWRAALGRVRARALVVSIASDVLYVPAEQRDLAAAIPGARLATIPSPHGHDGFLIEGAAVNDLLLEFRQDVGAEARAIAPRTSGRTSAWAS
jgi:homoserine O-acetyltransferase